jgi:hypothetical protein
MMPSRTPRRSAWLGFTVLLGTTFMLAFAATLHAQVLNDPRIAEFDPSPDHWAVLDGGQPAVLRYELDVFVVGSSTPFGTLDMGKPSPDGDGKIRFDFAAQIAGWSLPGGNYEARVSAVGPEGEALSDPSNPFTFTAFHSCAVFLNPESIQAAAAGGRYATQVSTGADCAWAATAAPSWVTLSTGSGPGNGTFSFDVLANTSQAARTGTVTIGDTMLTINQAAAPAPCSYSLSPGSASVSASGTTVAFTVTAGPTCAWTATPSQSWTSIAGGSGTGNGTVSVTVAANTATSTRTGTVTVPGQTFTITQAAAPAPCSYSLSPGSANAPAEGGSLSFTVSADGTCSWTAAPGQNWLSVSNGVGTGTRTVTVNVAANSATSTRSGNVTVEGRTFTVNQAAAPPAPDCSYRVTPASFDFTAAGGPGVVSVEATDGCSWNVLSDQVWLVPAVLTGSGTGDVAFTVKPTNAAADKTARLTIGPWVVTVTQDGKLRRIK